jgi:hypothetical protein
MDAREGNVAIYLYDGSPTIEVAAKNETHRWIDVWSEFQSDKTATRAEQLRLAMTGAIQGAMQSSR